jgi:tetratricopeptide (TPR) repeat protein
MKRIIIALAATALLLTGTYGFAQGKYGADSANCIKYLSYYKEYFKQNNYDEALPNWRKAYSICPPTASQNMLIDGTTLIRKQIAANAGNATRQAALIDTLMAIHDTRAQYYPKYARTALNNKGLDMQTYLKDNKVLYDGYNDIIGANKEYTKPQIFLFDLNAAIELYKAGTLGTEDVISTYQNSLSYLQNIPATSPDAANAEKVRTDLESLFISSKVASCDNLIELYTPRFAANPNDVELVSNIVKMMGSTEGCLDNDLYMKAVTALYKMEPSYTSAYYLYRLNAAKNNVSEAVKYMEAAISYDESDAKTDGQYNYELATFCYKNGSPLKAYECARKAVSLDPTLAGKCYFLMGTIWSTTTCGGDEITRRAPYWVAVDYLIKARNADPTLAEEANNMIGRCTAYFPQTADAFMYNITDGQAYTVNCGGLSATTTVRTQK